MSQHAREHLEDYVRVPTPVFINPMKEDDEQPSPEELTEILADSILASQHDFDDYVPNRTP